MTKTNYNVIGVMSGTSLDGIDLAHISFKYDQIWSFNLLAVETVSYSVKWAEILSHLVGLDAEELKIIDKDYTTYLASIINSFIGKNKIEQLDAICSHGHTALHQPDKGITHQIGNLPLLTKLTNHVVVCDFRIQDVELGGQGAPLVPIGDKLLFSEYDACINLGGFANISFDQNTTRIAFDICPVNVVLNKYAKKKGLEFDASGAMAKVGNVHVTLLDALNALEYYKASPPKSLGIEWVEQKIYPILDAYECSVEDMLRTFTEHIAIQITNNLNINANVLFTGGGTYNDFLIDRIKKLKNITLNRPDNVLIDYKEALIFGLLGVLKLTDEINCLSSVTGASQDHCSGSIFNP
ncbi:anhydro-N-acetylmuramic acid kinase [Psychroserpens sp. BH13MA-6]